MISKKKPRRKCDECAACCGGWLKIDIKKVQVDLGKPCRHLASDSSGCGIYKTRPKNPCRKFFCSWAATDSPLPEWMRPDLSRAIVLFNGISWQGITLDNVIAVGEKIPKKTLDWLVEFEKIHQRPAIFKNHELSNGKFTGNKKIMVVAPQSLKVRIEAWLQAGNNF